VSALLLVGCAGNGQLSLEDQSGTSPTKRIVDKVRANPAQATSVAQHGEPLLERVAGRGVARIPAIEAYLNHILDRFRPVLGTAYPDVRVWVVPDEAFNAYAREDGNIYFGIGLLADLESDDEVAAVLAHELGHIAIGHFTRAKVSAWKDQFQNVATLALLIKVAQSSGSEGSKKMVHAWLATQTLGEVGRQVLLPQWGRGDEQESDLFAVDMLVEAGYNPIGMLHLLDRMGDWERKAAPATLSSGKEDEKESKWVDIKTKQEGGKFQFALSFAPMKEQISSLMTEYLQKSAKGHDPAEKRAEAVSDYLDRHYANLQRPPLSADRLSQVRSNPEVKSLLDGLKNVNSAYLALEEGKPDQAAKMFNSTAKNSAWGTGWGQFVLSHILGGTGHSDRALALLESSARTDKALLLSQIALANTQEQAGNHTKAQELYESAYETYGKPAQLLPYMVRVGKKISASSRPGGFEKLKADLHVNKLQLSCIAAGRGVDALCSNKQWLSK
jgi:predicted Zn-dependent protease